MMTRRLIIFLLIFLTSTSILKGDKTSFRASNIDLMMTSEEVVQNFLEMKQIKNSIANTELINYHGISALELTQGYLGLAFWYGSTTCESSISPEITIIQVAVCVYSGVPSKPFVRYIYSGTSSTGAVTGTITYYADSRCLQKIPHDATGGTSRNEL